MPGDTRHSQQVSLTIKYSELSEDVTSDPIGIGAVVGPEKYAKVKKWHINRVFYFLTCSSAMCLGTVALVPNPVVQGTALAIWAGSVGIGKFLLSGAYHRGGKTTGPGE